jgi:hypothetical protein
MKAVARAASRPEGLTGSLIFACCDASNLAVQQPGLLRFRRAGERAAFCGLRQQCCRLRCGNTRTAGELYWGRAVTFPRCQDRRSATLRRNYADELVNTNRALATRTYLTLFNVSKILPFIRRAISVAGRGFWHSDNGLSQKLESGNISNRLRAAAPRQVSGSFT